LNKNRGNTILICAAVLAVICFSAWMLAGTETGAAAPVSATTEHMRGPYTIQVKMNAAEAVMLKPNTFTVSIVRADEQPVSGAVVDITLFMPDMFCGTSTVRAVEAQPGQYEGDGIPLMAGSTSADVRVQLDGRTYTVLHPFVAVR